MNRNEAREKSDLKGEFKMKKPVMGSISLKWGYDLLKKSGPWKEKIPPIEYAD